MSSFNKKRANEEDSLCFTPKKSKSSEDEEEDAGLGLSGRPSSALFVDEKMDKFYAYVHSMISCQNSFVKNSSIFSKINELDRESKINNLPRNINLYNYTPNRGKHHYIRTQIVQYISLARSE